MIHRWRLALLASGALMLASCTTVRELAPHLGGHKQVAATAAQPVQAQSAPAAQPAPQPTPQQAHKGPSFPHFAAPHFAGLKPLGHAPAAEPAAGTAPPANVWPQTYAGLPPDPAMRFGTLSNGMRYVVMKNATPGGQASLRLRIAAGSMDEPVADQGLAHFLEHMAFDGSTHVPNGEMIKILERHGLAFGADTNASTSWEETVYKLDLPKADDDTVDTSLMLLREVASELTLNQDAIDKERGVVLSEERLRDTPGYRVLKQSMGLTMQGQLASQRFPIGLVDVIQHATHDQLEDLYAKYYRPERAVLVAVGDFDPDAMEARIKSRFGDWAARGPAGPDPDVGAPVRRGETLQLVTEPGAQPMVELNWASPPDLSPDGKARRRRETVETLGLAVLNRRLDRLVRNDDPPFTSAGAYRSDMFHSSRLATLQADARPGEWRKAMESLDQEQRRLVQYGVSKAELAEEVDAYRANLKAAADGAATRTTPAVAEDIIGTVETPEVETSPAEDLALFEETAKTVTPAEVETALKQAFAGSGPLVFVAAPDAIDGGDKAVNQAFAQIEAEKVAAPTVQADLVWPYYNFGPPSPIAERREVADLDTEFVRFENGVRLTVKPTKFRADQILILVRIGKGQEQMPADHATPGWAAASAFPEGGLDQLTVQDIDEVLHSKIVSKQFTISDDAFVLGGATRPDDLDVQLQLLAAYVSHPGWRPEAFERMHKAAPTILDQMDATPAGVLNRDLAALLHGGDKRWAFPSRAEIAAQTPAQLHDLLQQSLANGAIEVTVVGDITVDKAVDAVAATFGALPARPEVAAPDGPAVTFPAPTPTPIVLTHKGRADQGVALIAWPTDDFLADTQKARTLSILSEVLELRLTEQLRKNESVTYSPSASAAASQTFPHYGYLSARMEAPPAKLDGFFTDVAAINADLRSKLISDDELERAKKPAVDDLERRRETNEYWLSALSGAQSDPRRLTAIRTSIAQLDRVGAEDLRRAAQAYLTDDKAWKLEVKPTGAP